MLEIGIHYMNLCPLYPLISILAYELLFPNLYGLAVDGNIIETKLIH